MSDTGGNITLSKTTTHKVVIPFYVYAAGIFLLSTLLLSNASTSFAGHYFEPKLLSIVHLMALGWGTMMIMGASHQLVPVLIEEELYSISLAHFTFYLAAAGIPLLAYGFYVFQMGWPAQWGGSLIVLSVLTYIINLGMSISKSKTENVHAWFIFSASLWLLITTAFGLALVFNFSYSVLSENSLHYLPLHAHFGVVGWFLLMVMGVGSRLIPMFLISKYSHPKLLWLIYVILNLALLGFFCLFLFRFNIAFLLLPAGMLLFSILLFIYYCIQVYRQRIRKKVDEQMKLSLYSVLMMSIPFILLILVISLLSLGSNKQNTLVILYGFVIFFGWITAIILGMTFKTLPFIVWNKIYVHRSSNGKIPGPKDLFSESVFKGMSLFYLMGFLVFVNGIYFDLPVLLKTGSFLLIGSAILYIWNVFKIIGHQAENENNHQQQQ